MAGPRAGDLYAILLPHELYDFAEIAAVYGEGSQESRHLGSGGHGHAGAFDLRRDQFAQVPGQTQAIRSDPVFPSYAQLKIDGGAQSGEVRRVVCPRHVEPACVGHREGIVSQNGRRQRAQIGIRDIADARPLGREQPLVRTACIEIAPPCFDIDRHHADRVRAVHHGHGAVVVGQGGQFVNGRHKTRGAVDVGEDHDLGTWRDMGGKSVDDLPRGIGRRRQGNLPDQHVLRPGHVFPHALDGRVFLVAHQHLSAGLQGQTAGGDVHAHRGVEYQGHVFGGSPGEIGDFLAGRFDQGPHEPATLVAQRVLLHLPQPIDHLLDDRSRRWTHRAALEKSHAVLEVELAPNVRPECPLFISYGFVARSHGRMPPLTGSRGLEYRRSCPA